MTIAWVGNVVADCYVRHIQAAARMEIVAAEAGHIFLHLLHLHYPRAAAAADAVVEVGAAVAVVEAAAADAGRMAIVGAGNVAGACYARHIQAAARMAIAAAEVGHRYLHLLHFHCPRAAAAADTVAESRLK